MTYIFHSYVTVASLCSTVVSHISSYFTWYDSFYGSVDILHGVVFYILRWYLRYSKCYSSYFTCQLLFRVFISVSMSQLLDFEARSGEQVPLLLKMKRSQLALSKAVESGDTDLGESLSPTPYLSHECDITLINSPVCLVLSVHSGELPEERDEQRRFLHDSEEPAGCSESLQTGTHPHLHCNHPHLYLQLCHDLHKHQLHPPVFTCQLMDGPQ